MAKLFISYSRKDAWAQELGRKLRNNEVSQHDVFVDYRDIHAGVNFWDVICDRIEDCDALIYVLSPDSVTSIYCLAEVRYALALNKPILPLMLRECEFPQFLNDHSINYRVVPREMSDVLLLIERSLNEFGRNERKNPQFYAPPTPRPARPPQPRADVTQKNELQRMIAVAREQNESEVVNQLSAQLQAILTALTPQSFPVAKPPSSSRTPLFLIGTGVIVMVIMAILVALSSQNGGGNSPQATASPTTESIAQNPTSDETADVVPMAQPTITPTDELSPTPTKTATPSVTATPSITPTETPTLEIAFIVATLDAEATIQQSALNDQATLSARATEYAVGTQSAIDQTATATLWTATPTPNITASIEAYRVQQQATATEQYVIGLTATAMLWTDTPTPTYTATRTPTYTPTWTPTNTPTPTHTPSPTPTIPAGYAGGAKITANEQWTPVEQEFDGVMMVLVPAGCFMMGSEDGYDDEQPVHEQCFDEPFWIDKYEVTQAQFEQLGGQKANANAFTGINLPVERITWFEARDYCENNRGGRLPTEREWEYAARGPNNLIYPWGNDFVANNVVYEANANETAPVGSRAGGVSWVGAMDMSGNVWEWVSSLYGAYPYDENDESVNDNTNVRVLRGGSWDYYDFNVRASYRLWNSPTLLNDGRGFRCARSYSP